VKCAIGSGGSKIFSTVFQTDLYASSTTLFDHAFSVICLNKTADTLLVASGSRTDHGEVKDVSGQYPGLREEPLTTKIYCIPITASNLYLQNNETWLQNSGYVFCEGVRNEYDIALNAKGEIFGLENMGDRDDPEELNLLKKGKHYGFPWRMGGNLNPQQFSSYNPANDKLLPANLYAPQIFLNDPMFPAAPSIAFEEPIKNIGPDANWVRNPVSGNFEQRTDITSFTSHRSPLGLNFDVDSLLDVPYNASGFMLAYTTGGGGSGYLNSVDAGVDVCQLKLTYNTSEGKYNVQTTRLASGFNRMVDAILIKNVLYIMEETGHIYTLTFPVLQKPLADFTVAIDDNCKKRINISNAATGNLLSFSWDFNDGNVSSTQNPVHNYLSAGNKVVSLSVRNPRGTSVKAVSINLPNSVNLTGTLNATESTISGIEEITTNQQLNSSMTQQLFSIQNIQLLPGFTVNNGAIFSARIKSDCQ
jgi:PKD repeat protein